MNDEYSAATAYLDEGTVNAYERDRYTGPVGQLRWRREQSAVGQLIERIPAGSHILDCPCGIGRWWELLAKRASRITGVDISPAMLAVASRRSTTAGVPTDLLEARAESLPLADDSVDVSFCHALTKHLPATAQDQVVGELARVSARGVLISFSIVNGLTYEVWRRRKLVESFPLLMEQMEQLTQSHGLTLVDRKKCTTALGIEYSVLLEKSPGALLPKHEARG